MDDILAKAVGSVITYHVTDRLGSVRDVGDANMALINHVEYTGFGRILSETNPTNGDRVKFQGGEYQPDSGLYYKRNRWYDTLSGRFFSEDPIVFGGGDPNLYRFVGNDATNWIDPSGLQPPARKRPDIVVRDGHMIDMSRSPCTGGYGMGPVGGYGSRSDDYFNPVKGVLTTLVAPDHMFLESAWFGGMDSSGKMPASFVPPRGGGLESAPLPFESLLPGPRAFLGSRAAGRAAAPGAQRKTWQDFLPEAQKRLDAAKGKYGPTDAAMMAMSRKQALKRLEGLEKQVEDHIPKLTRRGSEQHLRHEIENWLKQMENAAEHVGEKTGAEWTAKIAAWRRSVTTALGE